MVGYGIDSAFEMIWVTTHVTQIILDLTSNNDSWNELSRV